MTTYLKAHLAAIGAALVAIVTTIQGAGHLERANVVQVAVAVLGVIAAYFVHNTAGGVLKFSQAIISSLVVVLTAAAPFVVSGHITYAQCVIVGVTVIQAVAVYWTSEPDTSLDAGRHETAAEPLATD